MAHPVRTFSCAIIVAVCAVLVVPVDGQEKPAVKLSAEEQKVLELTNAARKEKKLPPLKLSAQLTEAARKHSMNMAKQRKLEHKLDGQSVEDRVKETGYQELGVGENIYLGLRKGAGADDAFASWRKSPGHWGNILAQEFTEIGIGMARNGHGETYFTQVFAVPVPQ